MWLERVIRPQTGCASYIIGSEASGECAVFDPLWDPKPYLEIADKKGARIQHVIDSHSHADHVSGARRLTLAANAVLHLPALSSVNYPANRLKHKDTMIMGDISMEVWHLPGHRPELINLVVRDLSRGEEPWCILTADFLLVGDIARPDLAIDGKEGAGTLFDTAIPRLLSLPDGLLMWQR